MQAEVVDSFEIKGRVALEYGAAGVVVIFSPLDAQEVPTEGELVFIVKPDGWMRSATIGEVKLTSGAPGFFIPNLKADAVARDTRLRWGKDLNDVVAVSEVAAAGT